MKKYLGIISLALLLSCSGSDKERPESWQGAWEATWSTDPASFEGLEGVTSYTMPGKVTFDGKMVNIKAFGSEGCVFSKDTLDHTLEWKVSNDSLILINDENTPGMVYLINNQSSSQIKLQLMEDIFLTLEK